MKKTLMFLIFSVIMVTVLFASALTDNQQKIYKIDCEEYKQLSVLYRVSGLAMPSSTGPWSNAEMVLMLSRIDAAQLSDAARVVYEEVRYSLNEDNTQKPSFSFDLSIGLQGYFHTNTTDFQLRENWISGFNDQLPVLGLQFENWVSRNFYGYLLMPFQLNNHLFSSVFGATSFITNIPLVPPSDMKDIDFNFPYRAFLSIGGDSWNVEIGRDRLSWGLGETGNLLIGDQISYHNMAKATAFSEDFKYTFLTSFFPHPQNYYSYNNPSIPNGYVQGGISRTASGTITTTAGQSSYLNGISLFMAHRFEWRLFSGKVGLTATEGIMYMSKDNKLDLIALNPAMFWHNNYTRSLTNSILEFQIDWAALKGLNVYGQLVVDEFILPGEPVPGKVESGLAEPSGLGFIVGARYSAVTNYGALTVGLEGAKTDPYLYLRDGDLQSSDTSRTQLKGQYGINYVVAVREQAQAGGTTYYNEEFLGYQYGGDAVVGNLNLSFDSFSNWSASANVFFMAHGTHDKDTVWARVNDTTNDYYNVTTPTTSHQTENQADDDVSDRNAVCYTLVAGVSGSYSFFKGLDVFAQADFINIVNPGNVSGAPKQTDVQLTFGVSYTPF